MSQTHYTYLLMAQEPFCEALMLSGLPYLYYGVRSCYGKPEDDVYMGSSEHVDLARRCGIVFSKEIRGVYRSRKEANREEAGMLKHLKYHPKQVWGMFFNRSVPGEFPPGSYARKRLVSIGGMSRLHDVNLKVGNPSNGKGGTRVGSHLHDAHKKSISNGVTEFWNLVSEYSREKNITRPCLAILDLGDFKQWKETKYQNQGASK